MLKLNNEQEKNLRQLLDRSERILKGLIENCKNPWEYGQCREAVECLDSINKLKTSIGLLEDKPAPGNTLNNLKIWEE